MKLTLVKKQNETQDAKSFFFEPDKKVKYAPGQYFYITLPTLLYPDNRGATRHFTLSSSPTDGKTLRITTKIRQESGFKRSLDELKIGSTVEGKGPNGIFFLDREMTRPQMFIAGGIGITPFRSIIKFATDKEFSTPIYLVYANSTPEEIIFRNDIENWEQKNSNLKVKITITQPEAGQEKWRGLKGRIDQVLLSKLITDWQLKISAVTFWLVGPPQMVDAVEHVLTLMKVSSDAIKIEKFTGY
ncbi:MAG: hypothetical protein ACD_52C00142G0008 [uncultured bacterium]|nr:MAG: hypothetical protein ACD_52C00142G0008 [uncultured bacterium]